MKIIGVCMVLCLLQNCASEVTTRTYRLENGTSHEIKMEFYSFGIFQQTRHIIGEGLIFEGSTDNGAGSALSAGGALGADSIIVLFNNEKRQLYYSDDFVMAIPPTNRNILVGSDYEIINNELYLFTFTEEDYENAEEIVN